jgi:hypothetical protein
MSVRRLGALPRSALAPARPARHTRGMNERDDYAEPGASPDGPFPLRVVAVVALFVIMATLAVFGCLHGG